MPRAPDLSKPWGIASTGNHPEKWITSLHGGYDVGPADDAVRFATEDDARQARIIDGDRVYCTSTNSWGWHPKRLPVELAARWVPDEAFAVLGEPDAGNA